MITFDNLFNPTEVYAKAIEGDRILPSIFSTNYADIKRLLDSLPYHVIKTYVKLGMPEDILKQKVFNTSASLIDTQQRYAKLSQVIKKKERHGLFMKVSRKTLLEPAIYREDTSVISAQIYIIIETRKYTQTPKIFSFDRVLIEEQKVTANAEIRAIYKDITNHIINMPVESSILKSLETFYRFINPDPLSRLHLTYNLLKTNNNILSLNQVSKLSLSNELSNLSKNVEFLIIPISEYDIKSYQKLIKKIDRLSNKT